MKALYLITATALAVAVPVLADVKVVDSVSEEAGKKAEQQQRASDAQTQANAELYYQLQELQEEVMRLRGQLEEQQHQLNQLKQQGMDNYLNLDKRLSTLEKGGATVAGADAVTAPAKPAAVSPTISADTSEEAVAAYQKAYDLIPKRQFDKARTAFEAFVEDYPGTSYQANAWYWLGELYLIDGDKGKAKQAFKTILADHKGHNKYPEALYKMAVLNHEQGDKMTAEQQLQTLIDDYPNAAVVDKARSFLQKNSQ